MTHLHTHVCPGSWDDQGRKRKSLLHLFYTVYALVLKGSSLTPWSSVSVLRNFDVSILATTSKHNILHLNPLQTFPFKLQKGEKTLNCLPNETIWRQSLDDRSWRPKRLWGLVEGKADRESRSKKKKKERERAATSTTPCRESSLCRQDANYRAHTEKAWLGKKGRDTQTAGLPPLGPQHNHNANQPIFQYRPWE